MEIIHLILGKANPNRMNGVNKVVHQLVSKQFEFGEKVSIWGITKELTHNYEKRDFETRLFKANKNTFVLDKKLKKAILTKKSDVIFHFHGGWILTYFSLSYFLNKHSIPYIITPHGAYNTIAMQRSKWIKKVYFKLFERTVLNNSYKIHLIGESEIIGLQKMYKNSKTELIPYGFEATQTTSVEKINNTDFVIGFVGRLDIYTKGLDLLVNSFKEFQKGRSNAKLWIIGDSEEKVRLENLIKKNNISKKTTLWGKQFGEDKIKLMQQMDVFVHSSRNEGLPTSVLEACDLGIPVAVTKATNMGTSIESTNAGIVINNEDKYALTKAFLDLYKKKENGQLTQLGINGQEMVKKIYNWKKVINEFNVLYT